MKKMSLALVVASLGLVVTLAQAANPHFVGKTTAEFDGTDVVVSWKEAGLGNNQNINYEATAYAVATYVCVNNGGQCPNAANKTTVEGPVSATGTFSSGKNGQITESLALPAPGPGDFACPSGQTLTLAEVIFSDIQITDLTNGVSDSATPSSVAATLFVCP